MHTIEWIFAGIGVPVFLGICAWLYEKFHHPPPKIPESPASPVVPIVRVVPSGAAQTALLHKNTSASLDHWLDVTVRIRKGDYYSVEAGYRKIRIEVTDIRIAPISDKWGGHAKDQLAVELSVTTGGGVLYGGASTVFVDVNKFLVPTLGYEESAESIYAFRNKDTYCLLTRISVTHINAHDGCADVSLVDLSVQKTDSSK
jgi:hypothetical protein